MLALIAAVGCQCGEDPAGLTDGGTGPDTGTPGPDAVMALELTPAEAQLVTDGVTPATQAFVVTAVKSDGAREDVSAQATLTLSDPRVGNLAGADFTSALAGGEATLTAAYGGRTAEAHIVVTLQVEVFQPGPQSPTIPANSGDLIDNAPEVPGRAPTLVYPNDGVMFPPNLGGVEVHFMPGPSENWLFELRFEAANARVRVYTRCLPSFGGCIYTVHPDIWQVLADSARGLAPITLTIFGGDDVGSGRGTGGTIELNIAAADVVGGLYYWTTSNGTGIMRVDFGDPEQQPERFFPFSGDGCYGCHAVSRDGRRMSLSQNGQWDGRVTVVDVRAKAALTAVDDARREQFQSWHPDSDRFVGAFGDGNPPDTNLRIRNGDTGDVLETIPLGVEPTHPDWSPVGDRIAFTKVTHHQTSQRPGRGGIAYVSALAGGGWSAAVDLVPPEDGKNRYYPAYAPDGRALVYCESICANGDIYNGDCDGDADPVAKLWAVSADGGAPIALARANAPGVRDEGRQDLTNTYPKWAPFVDAKARDGSGRLMWFTFSSRRQYGLRAPTGTGQLLWMAAVDPDALARGEDGSYPAFALPFQDLSTSNHIAQWTTRIVPPRPDPGGSDGGTCREEGETCEPGEGDCCGNLACTESSPGRYICRLNL